MQKNSTWEKFIQTIDLKNKNTLHMYKEIVSSRRYELVVTTATKHITHL